MEAFKEVDEIIASHNKKANFNEILMKLTNTYKYSPVLMFLYFFGVNLFLCIGIFILFAAITRFIYVRVKHDWILNYNLTKLFQVCKESEIKSMFR